MFSLQLYCKVCQVLNYDLKHVRPFEARGARRCAGSGMNVFTAFCICSKKTPSSDLNTFIYMSEAPAAKADVMATHLAASRGEVHLFYCL